MAVGATALTLAGNALTAPFNVMNYAKAGAWDQAILAAGKNLAATTQPAALLPIVLPAIITGFLGVGLDAIKANPKIRVGRFTMKAV